MRKEILGAAIALTLASPALAADLSATPYSGPPSYEEGEYLPPPPPPVVVEPPPVVVVHRPVIVGPPPVAEYPFYPGPPLYAYAGSWHGGWRGYGRHFRGGW